MRQKFYRILDYILPSVLTGVTVNMLLIVGVFINVMVMPPTVAPPPWVMFLIGVFTGVILTVDVVFIQRAIRACGGSRQQILVKSRHPVP